ncbi:MAG: monovalent cation/H+ antiporter subunit D [Hydrogenophaga sp.]|uniref:monovalent cation/H+ antiporter subunit D n=1 Tax=Hydrogenophaga sp. TaxID=1904254 RepID=UPI00169638EF|nr:monovalent cation/H+ antiporter subunit D [Hydrogenophaga sp.]NIM40304.1 monovalent cation/H+ antiporter subunit D [Hydrogenophaga sp.]NIN25535.1 monovalent cation/H+ antiporter subunit D [Hydrogenophaga sp.]NIN30187.1 monovalent cation/H+ antiporter subunit D [Hydrogenophaga sp.]NIN54488.1 monovalent cation/H+ antiporter subunit D [Hydrogenophaga sp.]NIO50361.1 monovalent cation/H+ antiporter subunit D [Hydrogenophaga sp.]
MMAFTSLPVTEHLLVAPVLLPLGTAALMLMLGEGRRRSKAVINTASTALGLALAILLLMRVQAGGTAAFGIYLPGNWPVPYGIVLVADPLAAFMAVLAGAVGLAALLYALARWQHAGVYFHVLFQLQLMGLYGAFLTGDLFNLFVFFEVLLAASYGLLLHGGGIARVRAGLHYIAINLFASLLFLIGVALLYGVTGTLNMADIADKLPLVAERDRGLLHAGAAILAIAFLAKAALWPLNFWLPPAYGAASAPAAAVFAILTKVGVYAILRLWTLCFPAEAGGSAGFGGTALIWGGLATLTFGAIGMLASQQLNRLAGYSVIASSGTLIAAIGFDAPALSAGALFYLASSTLAGCALYLLVELLERAREVQEGPEDLDDGRDGLPAFLDAAPPQGINLDDNEEALIGRAIPAALAFLGVAFTLCAMVIAGLPPFSGFVSKLAMLGALIEVRNTPAWLLFALLIVSGLFAAISLMRVGMRHFWTTQDRPAPRLRVAETLPIAALLLASLTMVSQAETVLGYTRATADALHEPQRYIDAVRGATTVPHPAVRGGTP